MHMFSYTSCMQTMNWTYNMREFFCVLFGRSCLSLPLQQTCTSEGQKCSTHSGQMSSQHSCAMQMHRAPVSLCSCSMHALDQSPLCLCDVYGLVHVSPLHSNVLQNRCNALHITSASLCVLPADFKQVLGQRGSKGPTPPSKLTAHQTQIVKALIEAHADDVQVYSTSCTRCKSSAVCLLIGHSVQSVQTLSQYTSRHVMLCPTACLQIL